MGDRDQMQWETMQAELRSALQHQRAAYQQMLETQRELERLMERAQHLLGGEATENMPGGQRGDAPAEETEARQDTRMDSVDEPDGLISPDS